MTQKEKEVFIRKAEIFMQDIIGLIPDGCDISIRREADDFMKVNVVKWDNSEKDYEKAKRLNVMYIIRLDGNWLYDLSDELNESLKKKGLLLEENENTPAFAEVG